MIQEKTINNYQQEFNKISLELNQLATAKEWTDLYLKMVYWEIELESLDDPGMLDILQNLN